MKSESEIVVVFCSVWLSFFGSLFCSLVFSLCSSMQPATCNSTFRQIIYFPLSFHAHLTFSPFLLVSVGAKCIIRFNLFIPSISNSPTEHYFHFNFTLIPCSILLMFLVLAMIVSLFFFVLVQNLLLFMTSDKYRPNIEYTKLFWTFTVSHFTFIMIMIFYTPKKS